MCVFFQAEDGIRVAQESRGLGDVYKIQGLLCSTTRLPPLADMTKKRKRPTGAERNGRD